MEEIETTKGRIYRYIVQFQEETGGRSPSLADIAAAVGLKTSATVSYHIERDTRLRRCGYLCIEVIG
ncbi:MAG: hypothetical protein GY832_16500 [Chloroflexi bacterium]|nr:hypothetical protein [Chloroflexota bacterium]